MKHIQKELQKFQTNPPENCEGGPVSEFDLFKWELKLTGPDDSPYEGGTFTLKVEFPPDYPFKPPKCTMATKIYHPNIDSNTGYICLDILKDEWSPKLNLNEVVKEISNLMAQPNSEHPVVAEIAAEFMDNKDKYIATAKEWTKKFAS